MVKGSCSAAVVALLVPFLRDEKDEAELVSVSWNQDSSFVLDLKLLHQNETQANPRGLVLPFSSHKYFCSGFCFRLHLGEILVEHFGFNMVQTMHVHDASNDAWNVMWYLDNSFAVLLPKHVDSLVAGVQCSTKVFQLRMVICTVPCIRSHAILRSIWQSQHGCYHRHGWKFLQMQL